MADEWLLSVDEVEACDIARWYPRLEHVSFDTELLPLEKDVVAFLRRDGAALPRSCRQDAQLQESQLESVGQTIEWSDDEDADTVDDGGADTDDFDCPELITRINETVTRLGGTVLPKLNWSAPRDAVWNSVSQSLQCVDANDVFAMLKASRFASHDLFRAYDCCCLVEHDEDKVAEIETRRREGPRGGFVLALRRFDHDLTHAHEFRCFVAGRRLLRVTQRDHRTRFDKLHEKETQDAIKSKILSFFESYLRDFDVPDFVFDVVLDKTLSTVTLVDVAPFHPKTDSFLVPWPQLHRLRREASEQKLQLVLQDETHVGRNDMMQYVLPQELVDVCNADAVAAFAEACRQGHFDAGNLPEHLLRPDSQAGELPVSDAKLRSADQLRRL
ncbi:MAG: hypothetical protein MHM6MM_004858 [Cercozoa sp. M6MM]